jgi:hypothetical protein
MARLFGAVCPPAEVTAVLATLPRPDVAGVRWSVPEQWMVKVRPLGYVNDRIACALVEALEAELAGVQPVKCTIGPATRRLAGQWLGAPVDGLDDLAATVFETTEAPGSGYASTAISGGHRSRARPGTRTSCWNAGVCGLDGRLRRASRRPIECARCAISGPRICDLVSSPVCCRPSTVPDRNTAGRE